MKLIKLILLLLCSAICIAQSGVGIKTHHQIMCDSLGNEILVEYSINNDAIVCCYDKITGEKLAECPSFSSCETLPLIECGENTTEPMTLTDPCNECATATMNVLGFNGIFLSVSGGFTRSDGIQVFNSYTSNLVSGQVVVNGVNVTTILNSNGYELAYTATFVEGFNSVYATATDANGLTAEIQTWFEFDRNGDIIGRYIAGHKGLAVGSTLTCPNMEILEYALSVTSNDSAFSGGTDAIQSGSFTWGTNVVNFTGADISNGDGTGFLNQPFQETPYCPYPVSIEYTTVGGREVFARSAVDIICDGVSCVTNNEGETNKALHTIGCNDNRRDSLLQVIAEKVDYNLSKIPVCFTSVASSEQQKGFLYEFFEDGASSNIYVTERNDPNTPITDFTIEDCECEEVTCDCADAPLLSATNSPRMYRRLTNGGGTQWQSYSWQIQRPRNDLTGAAATITSETSAYYTDAGRTTLVVPATRYTPNNNPDNTGTIINHFVDYNTATYYNTATERSIYYRHDVGFDYNGCSYVYRNDYDYTVAGATTTWQYEEPTYVCGVDDNGNIQFRKSETELKRIDIAYHLSEEPNNYWFFEGYDKELLVASYTESEISLVAQAMGYEGDSEDAAEFIVEFLNKGKKK